MKKNTAILFTMITLVLTTSSYAENIAHAAIMSPGCSQQDIKAIAGPALKHISDKKEWKHTRGYTIKLDEDQMKMSALTIRMHKKGCFNNTQK